MPSGDITDLGSRLARFLLWSGLFALVGALIAGVLWWFFLRPRTGTDTDVAEHPARRFLRVAFGVLWIVDGLLQAQPRMPAGFVPAVVGPRVTEGPHWFASIVDPLLRAWTRHPVAADAAVVWLEIGIGLLLLLARRGRAATVACWAAIGASVAIWVLGEAFGGLLMSGAGWLTGAPGSALVYALAAALLLAPAPWWHSGRAQLLVRRSVAVWIGVAAVLEALPAEGFWRAGTLAEPFAHGAATRQPGWLNAPMPALARWAERAPGGVNLVVILLAAGVALWLWVDGRAAAIGAAMALCLATWWLAQDLGVLGGVSTDPDTGAPLLLLVAAALPAWNAQPHRRPVDSTIRAGGRAVVGSLAVVLAVVVPAVIAIGLAGPADSAAVAADSKGGLVTVSSRPAPQFALVDQRGTPVSTRSLRGKVVLVTFLDPVCTSDCPLIANQLAIADRALGDLAKRVEIVAVDSNPMFHHVADVAAFTDSHGLAGLANWHFLCGPAQATQSVLTSYGISVDIPVVGMIEHSEGLFFIRPDGTEAAYLDDGAAAQLTETYAQQVEHQLRSMLS